MVLAANKTQRLQSRRFHRSFSDRIMIHDGMMMNAKPGLNAHPAQPALTINTGRTGRTKSPVIWRKADFTFMDLAATSSSRLGY